MKEDFPRNISRRNLFKQSIACSSMAIGGIAALSLPSISFAASLSKEDRDKMTPDAVIEHFKQGNLRFRQNEPARHDYIAQKRSSASGQYPAAIILGCIDSRAPAEVLLDAGIGETFNARVAGNVSNPDILGSLEYACAVAGAKLILVMGHTSCGAVKGAVENAELGHLTGLLEKIKPAIQRTEYAGERVAGNYDFVDAVARKNVQMTVEDIRQDSPVLKDLEDRKQIKIVGSMYHLNGGVVDFFEV